ncbi:type II secretion system minor pseudopilin GspI [Rheinheimera sp. UJ51]|uniref:type II secretion system minor pseudopilin GspI n=1 Tax=unclassified Rheinheimera TaxID=115860 RepID=UPI001E5BDCAA|nr:MULTISPECIES: type II secretion system minor pseudopilin GspI [unclassified Rheinheimera]MCC5452151.1 type II secretion system minor pseudopilin GspI [Rheinheimera sp. UJ51]MCF4010708.1 type II secretion system minor pseudopilin GspI [Rheinheimera sp. UJ63]
MRQRGFTLLELLVALVIFATAGVAIMQASTNHMRALLQLEELTIASYVANNQLQQAQFSRTWPPRDLEQGEVEMANRTWRWQMRATTVPDQDLRELTVSVRLEQQPDVVIYQLKTYVGRLDE